MLANFSLFSDSRALGCSGHFFLILPRGSEALRCAAQLGSSHLLVPMGFMPDFCHPTYGRERCGTASKAGFTSLKKIRKTKRNWLTHFVPKCVSQFQLVFTLQSLGLWALFLYFAKGVRGPPLRPAAREFASLGAHGLYARFLPSDLWERALWDSLSSWLHQPQKN